MGSQTWHLIILIRYLFYAHTQHYCNNHFREKDGMKLSWNFQGWGRVFFGEGGGVESGVWVFCQAMHYMFPNIQYL